MLATGKHELKGLLRTLTLSITKLNGHSKGKILLLGLALGL